MVLKPLSAVLRDGDHIYAVARGTGVNQDGRTNGITVPNLESQAALIRRVLEQAGVKPHQVRYVEAHGTGTAVGDPIEAQALGTVLGKARADAAAALLVGSVKANIGHLEAAAGVAGLIKAALCLKHRQVPPQANLQRLNPAIPFDELRLKVPRQVEPLPEGEGLPCAAVNSFGYGGTNAHAILQQAPAALAQRQRSDDQDETVASERPLLLPLSARDPAALVELARRYAQLMVQPSAPALADICHSAALRPSHHEHRAVFVAATIASMAEQSTGFAEQGGGAPTSLAG